MRLAHFAVDMIARRKQQGRDETVETVEAQEQLDLGPPAQAQDAHRGVEQFVFGNLEQFVARESVQDMRQRLAVMAGGRQSRRASSPRRSCWRSSGISRGRKAVGAGGEQADKAMLAGEAAIGVEGLDADIIHMGAAMHQAAGVGFGDDQGLGFVEIGAHRAGQRGTLARSGGSRALRRRTARPGRCRPPDPGGHGRRRAVERHNRARPER